MSSKRLQSTGVPYQEPDYLPWDGRRVPITFVGGYLGAGKTTAINAVLAQADRPVAVIVNENGPGAAVTVPVIKPFGASISPVGNAPPVKAKVCGAVPPLAFTLNDVTTWPTVLLPSPEASVPSMNCSRS